MTAKRASVKDEEEKRRLRETLRTLERIKAPWFFDALLEQRLHGVRATTKRRWGTIIAVALGALLLIAVGYLSMTGDLMKISDLVRSYFPSTPDTVISTPVPQIQPERVETPPAAAPQPRVTITPRERPAQNVPEIVDSAKTELPESTQQAPRDSQEVVPDTEKTH